LYQHSDYSTKSIFYYIDGARRRGTKTAEGYGSPILYQMKHEKEIVEKQLRQQKEEEKRLKLERLKQKLDNFEEEVLTGQVIKELRTCWEVCTE